MSAPHSLSHLNHTRFNGWQKISVEPLRWRQFLHLFADLMTFYSNIVYIVTAFFPMMKVKGQEMPLETHARGREESGFDAGCISGSGSRWRLVWVLQSVSISFNRFHSVSIGFNQFQSVSIVNQSFSDVTRVVELHLNIHPTQCHSHVSLIQCVFSVENIYPGEIKK